MDAQQADELADSGHLSPDRHAAFLAVPRRWFIPDTVWRPDKSRIGPNLVPLHRDGQPDLWSELADGNGFVITQVDDGRPITGGAGELITSSASMPKVVAPMLRHLDVHGGEQILEIGTGTGWNAALLAHRLGAERITSVEIDAAIAIQARKALSDNGFGAVRVITADGAHGYPPNAPYDRIIATVASTEIPYAWVAQTRPGGRILTPSWALDYHGLLIALDVNDDGTATGHAVDHVSFMRLRHQRPPARYGFFRSTDDEERLCRVSETLIHPAEVANGDYALGAILAIGARVRNCQMDYFSSKRRDSHDGTLRLVDHDSRSWARLYYEHDSGASHTVHQYGPRRLWDEIEAAHTWWVTQGRPGADRWRFTVTPEGQRLEFIDG